MARRPRSVSARARILGTILAIACVGLVVVGGVTFLAQRERALNEVIERLDAHIGQLFITSGGDENAASSTPPSEVSEEFDLRQFDSVEAYLEAVVARLAPGPNEASLALLDGEPRFVPETPTGFDISENTQLIDRVLDGAADSSIQRDTAYTDQGPLRYIAVTVQKDGDPQTGVYIRAVDLDAEFEPVTASMITYGIAAIVMLAIIALGGWFVTGRLLSSPIRSLRDAADSITVADMGARIPEQGNDDISDLTRTVNSMLDRLEGSVDVQRQLLDDVRHELKTPITIVRGHLEMMDPYDVADVESTREIGISELDRLARLVEDIDLLASVEDGEQFTITDVDIGVLTARVAELVAVIPGHEWSVDATATGVVPGNPDRLRQAWLQLADNAAKYTPVGAPIEVGSSLDDEAARLWVKDHGPGIPAAVRHRIFRRFDRAHGARSVGGSGLGLAIVEVIAKTHGGVCLVSDTPGGGATFTIVIPPTRTGDLPAPIRAGDVVLQRQAAG